MEKQDKLNWMRLLTATLAVAVVGYKPARAVGEYFARQGLEERTKAVETVREEVDRSDIQLREPDQITARPQAKEERARAYDGKLVLKRIKNTDKSTIGELYLDGKFLCYTLEPPWRNNETGRSCIPSGDYDLRPRSSGRFGEHYLVEGTGKRDGILIHVGNFPKDTTGCIVVGDSQGENFVGNSRATMGKLRQQLGKGRYDFIVEDLK